METMSVLRLLPSKGEELARFSKQIIESVQTGETSPLEVLVMLKAFAKASEAILDCIKPNIDRAADKYSEKSIELFGARLERSEVGVSYDYAHTGDPDWQKFKVAESMAAENRKARETFLRALREPMTIVDTETGEAIEVRPPLKKSTTGIKVFIK